MKINKPASQKFFLSFLKNPKNKKIAPANKEATIISKIFKFKLAKRMPIRKNKTLKKKISYNCIEIIN